MVSRERVGMSIAWLTVRHFKVNCGASGPANHVHIVEEGVYYDHAHIGNSAHIGQAGGCVR